MENLEQIIKNKILEYGINDDDAKIKSFAEYIGEYKDQRGIKRKKKEIGENMRCEANRANGEQCTRKKKNGSAFCGTHDKGIPHGKAVQREKENGDKKVSRVPIWTIEIRGIIYYVDGEQNVYRMEDILENKVNPLVIGRYEVNEIGAYVLLLFDNDHHNDENEK